MEWYFFALLAPAFWALNNISIKFLITNKFKSFLPLIFTVISIDLVFASGIFLLGPIAYSLPYSFFAFAVGVMPLMAFWFYSKALIKEEISRIVTLFQLIPIFVLFFSVVFLKEIIQIQRYFGIIMVVIASIMISHKKTGEKQFSSALKFMVPFGIIIAFYTIADKIILGYLDYLSVFFWNVLGTFCGVLFMLLLPKSRTEIVKMIAEVGIKVIFATFVGEGFYVIGTICSLIALSLVDASLASLLFGLQPFYVFFYANILSVCFPKILREEISKDTLLLKASAIALMFVGTLLVV